MVDDKLGMLLEIYDTIADPGLWLRVLDRFADTLDARGCIVFALDGYGSGRKIAVSHIRACPKSS